LARKIVYLHITIISYDYFVKSNNWYYRII